jgi:hypothetical protein
MKNRPIFPAVLSAVMVSFLLAACSGQKMESARKAIAEAQAALSAAGPDAVKYIPKDVADTTNNIARLQSLFDAKDYDGVLDEAPAVLAKAQGLPTAAEAARVATVAAFSAEWDSISGSAPAALAAIQSRVDVLSKAAKLPEGMDAEQLELIKTELALARQQWAEAGTAHAEGKLEAATALGLAASNRAGELLNVLGMSAD